MTMSPSDEELLRKYGHLIGLKPGDRPTIREWVVLRNLDKEKADWVLKVLKARRQDGQP